MNYFRKPEDDKSPFMTVTYFEDDQIASGAPEAQGFIAMTEAEFELHLNPPPTVEQLIAAANFKANQQVELVYIPRVMRALRLVRMAGSTQIREAAEASVADLDEFAQAIDDVPSQPGYPQTIVWPEPPL